MITCRIKPRWNSSTSKTHSKCRVIASMNANKRIWFLAACMPNKKTNPNKKIKQEYDCAKSYKASFQNKGCNKGRLISRPARSTTNETLLPTCSSNKWKASKERVSHRQVATQLGLDISNANRITPTLLFSLLTTIQKPTLFFIPTKNQPIRSS